MTIWGSSSSTTSKSDDFSLSFFQVTPHWLLILLSWINFNMSSSSSSTRRRKSALSCVMKNAIAILINYTHVIAMILFARAFRVKIIYGHEVRFRLREDKLLLHLGSFNVAVLKLNWGRSGLGGWNKRHEIEWRSETIKT